MAIWALIVLATIASMAIAERMARARGRSVRTWVWIAAIVGPLSPVALYALGNRPIPD
jgi:NO-binding membrane sensor protein with MHYT domain